jgi:hypothetical protein
MGRPGRHGQFVNRPRPLSVILEHAERLWMMSHEHTSTPYRSEGVLCMLSAGCCRVIRSERVDELLTPGQMGSSNDSYSRSSRRKNEVKRERITTGRPFHAARDGPLRESVGSRCRDVERGFEITRSKEWRKLVARPPPMIVRWRNPAFRGVLSQNESLLGLIPYDLYQDWTVLG